jgi:hypothetical protein
MMPHGDEYELGAPQREAAMFYGLFLRGHSVETLRQDIDVPKPVVEKWLKSRHYEPSFRDALRRVYHYRKTVLAIFDELVTSERTKARLQ